MHTDTYRDVETEPLANLVAEQRDVAGDVEARKNGALSVVLVG